MDVHSHEYQREGTLVEWRDNEQTAVIQFGALKVTVGLDDLFYPSEDARREHLGGSSQSRDNSTNKTGSGAGSRQTDIDSIPRTDNNTVDLRGLRAEEARDRLDRYLDDKFLDGFGGVYVIHGHGTGALRRAVRGYLTESPYADEFRRGDESEGGDGVTVVKLRDEIDRS
jgi:DNA mismatch repair protein MutS2